MPVEIVEAEEIEEVEDAESGDIVVYRIETKRVGVVNYKRKISVGVKPRPKDCRFEKDERLCSLCGHVVRIGTDCYATKNKDGGPCRKRKKPVNTLEEEDAECTVCDDWLQ